MDNSPKFKFPGQWFVEITFFVLAFAILFVSLVRAGLNMMKKDNNENRLRVNPIEFTKSKNNEIENCVYKLPEVRTLPDNPTYFFKQIRDSLWVELSNNSLEKSQVILLLADKKMAETLLLYKSNKFNLALDTGEEAINKLKYADKTVNEISQKNIEVEELKKQISNAGCAYKKALFLINQDGKLNEEKYKKVIKELETWNEERQKNKSDN